MEGEVREDKGELHPIGAGAVRGEVGQPEGACQCGLGF